MGAEFSYVTIEPEEQADGHVADGHISFSGSPWSELFGECDFESRSAMDLCARDVCISLAGPLAEALYSKCWQQPCGAEGDDEYVAFEISKLFSYSESYARLRVNRLRFAVLEMLRVPSVWAAVEEVARALLAQKTLDYATVRDLVHSHVLTLKGRREPTFLTVCNRLIGRKKGQNHLKQA
jgi:hypothetical protein